MGPLLPTFHVAATVYYGFGDLTLGVVLIVLAMVHYRVAPWLEEAVQSAWFPNREAEGRRIRTVAQPMVLAGFGGLCLLAGTLHLI